MKKEKMYEIIVKYLKSNDASSIAVFGSYSRGEETKDSDIDILVEFSKIKSLFELSRITRELEGLINKKVDLVTKNSISPYIFESVKKELEQLA